MRIFNMALGLIGAVVCGCAHEQPTQPATQSVAAYHAVRMGEQQIVRGKSMTFCAGNDAVNVLSRGPSDSSQYADKFRDSDLQSKVRQAIRYDSTLASQDVTVDVQRGQAVISGNLASDTDAVAAAKDALGVPGIVSVKLQTTSPETPQPPRLAQVWCSR